jgi:hypothetical protein
MSEAKISCTEALKRVKSHVRELEFLEAYLENKKLEAFPASRLKKIKIRLVSSTCSIEKSLASIDELEKASDDISKDEVLLRYPKITSFDGDNIWSLAKTCTGVTAISKVFQTQKINQHNSGSSEKMHRSEILKQVKPITIDIVCKDGSRWIKASSVSQKTLMYKFAEAGFAEGDSSDASGDEDNDTNDPTGIIAQAKRFIEASEVNRHRYKKPQICFIFPRLTKNEPKSIMNVFKQLQSLGIVVNTSEDIPEILPIEGVIQQMISPNFSHISSTINLDYAILKAMVSDVCNTAKKPEEYVRQRLKEDAEHERLEPVFPTHIWPVCDSRQMVCTRETVASLQVR